MPMLLSPPTAPGVAHPDGARHSAEGVRAALVMVVIGALIASAAMILARGPDEVVGRSGTFVGSGEEPAEPTEDPGPEPIIGAEPGTCLNWSTSEASDIGEIDCGLPHLFEVASTVDLSGYPGTEFGPTASVPGTLRLGDLRDELCVPAVTTYLDGRFDPAGRFTVGLINPGPAVWAQGLRTLRCGLQEVGRGGTPFPFTGLVSESDQSDVTPVGTCIGIDGTLPTDPVDCSEPHAAQTVAVVDMGLEFTGEHPPLEEQDSFLDTTCATAANTFTGAPEGTNGPEEKGLTVFWDNLAEPSWAAGSRKVNCYVGTELPGGGFAPVSGDAQDSVVVGTEPAPAAPAAPPGPAPSAPVPTSIPRGAVTGTPTPTPTPEPSPTSGSPTSDPGASDPPSSTPEPEPPPPTTEPAG